MDVPATVFLVDVDNTLLDNDRIIADLRTHIEDEIGPELGERYWAIFEAARTELGYSDYLGALQQYRIAYPTDVHLLHISEFLLNYRFAERVYPGAFNVLAHLGRLGTTVILTDGDVVFQPLKVSKSGLARAVDQRVLIYIHKETMLKDVERRFPADQYVLIDDKLRILTAIKEQWQHRVTTVFPRQGHYALDPTIVAAYPEPDLSVASIADLTRLQFLPPTRRWGLESQATL